ncbi:lipopolysaccharide biosynthesis protein [Thermodesulfobacteriota bacterium]
MFISRFKSLFKDAAIYGVGNALGSLISIITAPILTRIFTTADYGAVALIQTCVNFLSLIAGLYLISAVYRYYYEYNSDKARKAVLSTSLYFFLFLSLIFAFALWIFSPLIAKLLLIKTANSAATNIDYDFTLYLRILSPGLFLVMMNTFFIAILRMQRKPLLFMILNIIQILTHLFFIVFLVVYLQKGIEGALLASVISNGVSSCIGYAVVAKNFRLVLSIAVIKNLISYSLPQLPSVLMNWGLTQMNVFFLNFYGTLTDQGYYSIAFRLSSVFLMLSSAFRLAWDPFALSAMKQGDAKSIYSQGYTVYVLIFLCLGGLTALFAKPALIILTPEPYHISYSIVPFIIIAFFYQGSNNIIGIGISITKKTKYISYAQFNSFVINIALNILLIHRFKAWGAAGAFLGAAIVQSFSYYYFAQKLYPINYQFMKLQLLSIVVFLIVCTQSFIISNYNFYESTFTAFLFFFILLITTYGIGLDYQQRKKTIVFVKQKILSIQWS